MRLVMGCDQNGFELKKYIYETLKNEQKDITDLGIFDETPVLYPDIAIELAKSIKDKNYDRGILICGTGIGMAISANKISGVYAAVCHDIYSTERSILSNNVQIMCIGALVIGKATALTLIRHWLGLSFKESPSLKKINKIKEYESMHL